MSAVKGLSTASGWLENGNRGRRLISATAVADVAHRIMRPDDSRAALCFMHGRINDHPAETLHKMINLACDGRIKGLGGNGATKKKQCGCRYGDQSEQPTRFRFARL